MNTKEALSKLIAESDVSADDKELLRLFIETAEEQLLAVTLELIRNKEMTLSIVVRNLKEKLLVAYNTAQP